jgi:hypothetical protein
MCKTEHRSGLLQFYKMMTCRGEAAAISLIETDSLVSPPPRPSWAATEEGQATGREGRPFPSTVLPGCLPPTPAVIILSICNNRFGLAAADFNLLWHYERGAVIPAQAWAEAEKILGTLVGRGGMKKEETTDFARLSSAAISQISLKYLWNPNDLWMRSGHGFVAI